MQEKFSEKLISLLFYSVRVEYSPLYLYGEEWQIERSLEELLLAFNRNNINKSICVLNGELFANQFILSISGDYLETFKKRIYSSDILIFTGLEKIRDKDSVQEFFYFMFDHFYEHKKQIIIGSAVPPSELCGIADRIITQMQGCLICELENEEMSTIEENISNEKLFLSFIEYLDKIKQEKLLMSEILHIKTGTTPSEGLNTKFLPRLSPRAKEYGFELKLFNMISSLNMTNEIILENYRIWKILNTVASHENPLVGHGYFFSKHSQLNAYIIYDIRRFIDQVIAICWCLTQEKEVNEVQIDSIGAYLNSHCKGQFTIFGKHLDFLELVNNISNTYKHSVPNDMATPLIGKYAPSIYALDGNRNTNIFEPVFTGISLEQLINDFNLFYQDALAIIDSFAQ